MRDWPAFIGIGELESFVEALGFDWLVLTSVFIGTEPAT